MKKNTTIYLLAGLIIIILSLISIDLILKEKNYIKEGDFTIVVLPDTQNCLGKILTTQTQWIIDDREKTYDSSSKNQFDFHYNMN